MTVLSFSLLSCPLRGWWTIRRQQTMGKTQHLLRNHTWSIDLVRKSQTPKQRAHHIPSYKTTRRSWTAWGSFLTTASSRCPIWRNRGTSWSKSSSLCRSPCCEWWSTWEGSWWRPRGCSLWPSWITWLFMRKCSRWRGSCSPQPGTASRARWRWLHASMRWLSLLSHR